MTLPQSWDSIELWQWVDLQTLSTDSVIERNMQILSIVTEQDVDEFGSLTASELIDLVHSMKFLKTEPTKGKPIEGYRPINLSTITVGEFIDLEHYTDKLEVQCAILFRKFKLDEWGNEVFEPYKYNPVERSEFFAEKPVSSVYSTLIEYLQFRNNIKKSYSNIFEADIDEDEDDTLEEVKPDAFGWERLIFSLCNDDITKFDEVTDLPIVFVLNMMTMKSIK